MTSINKLSLAEELLLITLDDESGRLLDSIKPFAFEIAIAASLIMELSLKGKLDSDAEKLYYSNDFCSLDCGKPKIISPYSGIIIKKSM